jgi:hypothetical protein
MQRDEHSGIQRRGSCTRHLAHKAKQHPHAAVLMQEIPMEATATEARLGEGYECVDWYFCRKAA